MVKVLFIRKAMYIVVILRMTTLMVNFIMKGKMGKPMKEIGNKVKSMDMAFIIGLTVVHMRDNMQMVKDMERVL